MHIASFRFILLSSLTLAVIAAPQAVAQGFSNWSTPTNISTINTSSFEG